MCNDVADYTFFTCFDCFVTLDLLLLLLSLLFILTCDYGLNLLLDNLFFYSNYFISNPCRVFILTLTLKINKTLLFLNIFYLLTYCLWVCVCYYYYLFVLLFGCYYWFGLMAFCNNDWVFIWFIKNLKINIFFYSQSLFIVWNGMKINKYVIINTYHYFLLLSYIYIYRLWPYFLK